MEEVFDIAAASDQTVVEQLFSLHVERAALLKALKVVKPPSRPIPSRSRNCSLSPLPPRASHPARNPMARLPMALAASVAKGKAVTMGAPSQLVIDRPSSQRRTAPAPPPRKTCSAAMNGVKEDIVAALSRELAVRHPDLGGCDKGLP